MADRETLKSELAATPDCLPIEELSRLSVDEASAHVHVAGCARCQTELALFRKFESEEPLPGEGAAVAWISAQLERRLDEIKNPALHAKQQKSNAAEHRSWVQRMFLVPGLRFAAPVAVAVAVAAIGFMMLRSPKEPELHANLGSGPVVYRSQEVQAIAPVGNLQKAPHSLEWKPIDGVALYKVSLEEVDHTEVWNAQTHDTSVTIPHSVVVNMKAGKPFLWKVTALDSNGAVFASSQAQRFVVERDQTR